LLGNERFSSQHVESWAQLPATLLKTSNGGQTDSPANGHSLSLPLMVNFGKLCQKSRVLQLLSITRIILHLSRPIMQSMWGEVIEAPAGW